MAWGLCRTEEDLLYSHKCPSLTKPPTEDLTWETHVKVRTVWQCCQSCCYTRLGSPWATAECFETLSCIPLHSGTWKINPEAELAEQRAYSIRNYFLGSTMLILGERKLSVPACWEDWYHPEIRTNVLEESKQNVNLLQCTTWAGLLQGAQHCTQISVSICISYNPQRVLKRLCFAW